MSGGHFYDKVANEAIVLFDHLAETTRTWYTTGPLNPELKVSTSSAPQGGGKFHLKENEELQAKIATLSREVKTLKLKNVHSVSSDHPREPNCGIYGSISHVMGSCPINPMGVEGSHEQVDLVGQFKRPYGGQGLPFSETYNSGWRNHPNFNWKTENPQPF